MARGVSSPGAVLGHTEQPRPVPQENGRRQKQHLGLRFDALYGILEERKKELLQSIAAEQEAKLQRVRGLIRQYGDHLEASSKLVESAIQAMEEPQMALYLQVLPGERGAGAALGRCGGAVVLWGAWGGSQGAVLTQKDLWMPLACAGVELWWG